jgi:hypothetical protein
MDTWSDREKQIFEGVAELVYLQMLQAGNIQGEDIEHLSYDSKLRYWSFELGVIEFYDQILSAHKDDIDCIFTNFLIFYSNWAYPGSNGSVFNFWEMELAHQKFLDVRELGFMSVNNGSKSDGSIRDGHCAWCYFRDARIT